MMSGEIDMKEIITTLTGFCLYTLANSCYATVNIQGTYSGVMVTNYSNAEGAVCGTSNSTTRVDVIIDQKADRISSRPFSANDVSYQFTHANAKRDGTDAVIEGIVTRGAQGANSFFRGAAGTDFANASFVFSTKEGCIESSHLSLIKTAGPRTSRNNSAADAVQQAFSSGDTVLQASNQQRNNVKTRINNLKHRANRPSGNALLDTSQLNVSIDGQNLSVGRLQKMINHELSGGGASSDDISGLDNGFGVFINGNVEFGDRKSSVNQQGYDNDGAGVTVGADYRFTDNFFMGAALGYNSSDTEHEGGRGNLSSDVYSATLYTTYNRPAGYFFDTVLRYGYSSFDGQRHFNRNETPDQTPYQEMALLDYDANDYSIDLETGYEIVYKGLSMQPYVGAHASYAEIKAYKEAAGSLNTSGYLFGMERQRAYEAQVKVGTDLSYVFNTPYAVFIPRFNFEWRHEFLEDYPRVVDSYTLGQKSSTTVTTFSDLPDADTFSIGGGVAATLPYGITSFVNYNTLLSAKYLTSHNINFGVRWSF